GGGGGGGGSGGGGGGGGGGLGIFGAELVDDENAAAGPHDPRELGDDEVRAVDVMERPQRSGEVEGGVVEVELAGVADDEGDIPGDREAPRALDTLRVDLDRDDLAHVRRERERQRAEAAADVERPLVAARKDEVADPLRERGAAVELQRLDEVEAVSHRARSAWCGAAPSRSRRRSRT